MTGMKPTRNGCWASALPAETSKPAAKSGERMRIGHLETMMW
jgi:hypothetical protein